jgi:hypothetical protein
MSRGVIWAIWTILILAWSYVMVANPTAVPFVGLVNPVIVFMTVALIVTIVAVAYERYTASASA